MHKIEIPQEIRDRSRALRGDRDVLFDRIDPSRTAHVVVDLQNGFMREGAPVEVPVAREIVDNVNRISAALREAGGRVVYLRFTYDANEPLGWPAWYEDTLSGEHSGVLKEAFTPGSHDHDLWPGLDVLDGDLVVDKTRFSGFVHGTCPLHDILQEAGIDTLIITGTLTNCCCESTARDANQLNYKVIFVTDGNATHTDWEHNATLSNMAAIFSDLQSTDRVWETIERSTAQLIAAE
ncbi:isochorismatase family cysteine hydrolase [Microbaculum marinum]|uniref:Isochorismatase family cysteine hydrolase n=1 Tax=Microbaculum marinum TaxID=1764581 RepID=A0AAW9RPY6_9HYPH